MADGPFRLVKRSERPIDIENNDEPQSPRSKGQPAPTRQGPFLVARRGSHPTAFTEDGTVNTGQRKERRGFASMSPEKQREIASKGGRAAHEKGTAHEWTADEARSAGRKGGQVSRGGRGRLLDSPASSSEPLQPAVSAVSADGSVR